MAPDPDRRSYGRRFFFGETAPALQTREIPPHPSPLTPHAR
jgi:hypothetical protein